jgi:hypothetical protein
VKELFARKQAMFILSQKYPLLAVEDLLSACLKNEHLQKEIQKQLDHLTELLDKSDSSPVDEALEALKKWTPPDAPPN